MTEDHPFTDAMRERFEVQIDEARCVFSQDRAQQRFDMGRAVLTEACVPASRAESISRYVSIGVMVESYIDALNDVFRADEDSEEIVGARMERDDMTAAHFAVIADYISRMDDWFPNTRAPERG